ncbi:MAG TPA: cupin [Nitrospirota bacterium]|nr:cupin [Nitrospirota bacterium]
MPIHITMPTTVAASGNRPKIIDEFVGRLSSGTPELSIARMKSPGGWSEPGQTPDFDEYTFVLRGVLKVTSRNASFDVRENEAIICRKGEWVQYSTPGADGAEYIAICIPAFSPSIVHRDS